MPRAYSPEELEHIRARLMEIGREWFPRYGLKKTTVGELATRAGIGKGTFYLLFDSKEALFLAVQEQVEAEFKAALVAEVEALRATPRAMLRRYFELHFQGLEEHPFLRLLAEADTLEALLRAVDPAALSAHRASDRAFFLGLLSRWQGEGVLRDDVDPDDVFAASTALFALTLQRPLIGDDVFERASRLLADSLAERLAAPPRESR